MNWLDQHMLMALVNLAFCCGIGAICVCRTAVMSHRTTRPLARAAYAAMACAATVSGFSHWWFGDWPGWSDLAMSGAVLVYMISGMRAWRFGLPDFASRPMPLDPLEFPPTSPTNRSSPWAFRTFSLAPLWHWLRRLWQRKPPPP
jgi:hypothetical protein